VAEHAHFSSINIHTVYTYACSYIYILLLLYIIPVPEKGSTTLRIYEGDTHTAVTVT